VPEDWLREQYQQRGRSIADIASELELPRTSVRRALAEAGIPIDDLRHPVELDDIEWLSVQDGATNVELARRLGVTAEAVSRARQRHGLRVGVRRESRYPQLDDREWLHERYVEQGMTQAELAAAIGCSRSAVALAMDRLGVPARPNKVPEHPELHDPEWLAGQVAAGGTPREIAEGLGCHRTTVAAALRAHGISVPDAGS